MKCKLSDFIEINPKEALLKNTLAKKVAMEKLAPYCREISGYEIETYTGGSKFRNKDTIMARITPCLENGKIAQVNILDKNEVGFGSTEFIVFRAINGIADPDYIYYLIISELVRIPAIKSMVGSSGRQRVQTDVVENLEIDLPDFLTQKKIAKILSALDDKIEYNNQINKNLEEQARALFKKFFIDIDLIPDGWSKGCLLDIADYLNGLAMQKFRPSERDIGLPVLKIKELRQGMCDDSSEKCSSSIKDEYIVHDGDVIFSWSGSLLVDFWCGGTCGLNQHLFKVTSKNYDKWFYYFWTLYHLGHFSAIASAKATTMGHIKREDLMNAEVFLPSKKDYKKIDILLKPIVNLITKNRIENRKLAQLRDTLLPKLMSGELDVDKVNI